MMVPDVLRLLDEAAEWRLYGLLFEYPSAAWRSQLTALLPDLRDPERKALAEAALEQSSPGLHTALFGPAGAVPVREVTWQGGVQFGYLLSELSAYYEAFGYTPSAEEAPDHLAIQLGFVAYLRMKEALAVSAGDVQHAQVTADAAARFLKEHVAISAEPVARALETLAPPYLAKAARRILAHAGPPNRSSYPLSTLPVLEGDSGDLTCGVPAPPLSEGEL